MIQISADQVTGGILSLFDFSKPRMPRAFNVLEGITQGEIFLDDRVHPDWASVHEVTYGTLYPGGKIDADVLLSLVRLIRETHEVGFGCWLDNPLNDMLPANPEYHGRNLYFTERSRSTSALQLPAGYKLALRDGELPGCRTGCK